MCVYVHVCVCVCECVCVSVCVCVCVCALHCIVSGKGSQKLLNCMSTPCLTLAAVVVSFEAGGLRVLTQNQLLQFLITTLFFNDKKRKKEEYLQDLCWQGIKVALCALA